VSPTLKIIGIVLFYIVTIGTGILMHRSGRPFNPLISVLHKLIALAVVVATILLVRSGVMGGTLSVPAIVLIAVTFLLLISLFVTGALLSGEGESSKPVLLLHNLATVLAPVGGVIALLLCFKS